MATISVGDLTPRNQYTATNGQTVFAYSFPIFADADIKVYIGSTLKTLTTHYTVSGAGTDNGGNVTLGSGATTGDIVTIYRDMPVARTSDYQTNGDLLAETLNDDLDKLAMMIQQIEYDLNSRTLRFGQFTTGIPLSEFTENASDRAGKVLSFDSSGEPNITQELGVFKGNWAASTVYVLRDIIKDTSNNNIYICTTAHTSSGSQPISSNTDVAKWTLLVDSAAASTSATAAASSATAAASSATAAASSATAAATSKSGADTAKTAAETAKTAAETAETNAETAETNAETAETNAEASEAAALVSKNAAATSATSASTSASTATTKASEAASSATAAASSASTASGHATTATTKASEAASSATGAASSATTATSQATTATSQATAAAASAAAAASSADAFDDTYLGAKSSDPTQDNDGDALTAGDLYFNTSSNVLKAYTGSAWNTITSYSVGDGGLTTNDFTNADHTKLNAIEASADVTDATNVTAAGALMDSEVTNLAAVKAFDGSDYATAAQGTLATNALPKAGGTMTGAVVGATDTDTSNSGTVDLDFTADTNFVLTLTGNITSLTASNEVVGQSGFIVFIQDGTGSRTVALHGDYETAAGAGLTLTSTASATDIVPYVVAASSRILLGTPQLAFS
jgi:chemotaxis protein histidine kinase CheA